MRITRCGDASTIAGDAMYFSGSVWQESVVQADPPARLRASIVRFDPEARTHWHTHPLGQTLYVLAGRGFVQVEGEPPQTIAAGDTVFIPAGEKHWHGAGPKTAMTHLAMQEALDGRAADWMEAVSGDDYAASTGGGEPG